MNDRGPPLTGAGIQIYLKPLDITFLLFSVCVCFQKVHLALSGKTSRFYPKLVRIDSIDTLISQRQS